METNQGPAVEQLLAIGAIVYPVNPKSAQRYRERKAPSGVKNDQLDAWSLGDALRLDGRNWKALRPEDPLVAELKLLSRDEVTLIGQRTQLVNQLRQALNDYFPAALEAFEDWTPPAAWHFIAAFPTPQALQQGGRRRWEKFLHVHKIWRPETAERRLGIFAQATALAGQPATIQAKSILAVSLARMLLALEAQLRLYRERIEALFAQPPDHDLFRSLPGAGVKLAPRLLAEIGDDRDRFLDANALQCYAGTAPISFQSGQVHRVKLRQACSKTLRSAVHQWSDRSRFQCAWAQAYYQHHRALGKSHACALRCLGQGWLKIFWKMWQTRSVYNESAHTKNQVRHGSWVLKLNNQPPVS